MQAAKRCEGLIPGSGRPCPLEEGMTIHYDDPAWEIPWTKECRLQATESQESDTAARLNNNKQEVIIIRIRSHLLSLNDLLLDRRRR